MRYIIKEIGGTAALRCLLVEGKNRKIVIFDRLPAECVPEISSVLEGGTG